MGEKISVLVVEDEAIIGMEIRQRLEQNGYRVVGPARSGFQAIATARLEKPDLVLMDIGLRGEMSGFEAAEQILAERRVAIVFLTAWTDSKTLDRVRSIGRCGFLAKPFREHEMVKALEEALAWSVEEQP